MAITKLNYVPGAYEAITDEPLDDSPILNTWYYFKIDGWSHVISDIVLKQSGTPLPGAAYELIIDTKYTGFEENESAKTLYAKWRIINGTYDLIATTVSGNNFGTYVDNEAVKNKVGPLTEVYVICSFDQIGVVTATWTKVEYNSEQKDTLGDFNTTTNSFTAPATGAYLVNVGIGYDDNSTGIRYIRLNINASGSAYFIANQNAVNGDRTYIARSFQLFLTAADVVYIEARQTSGGNLTIKPSGTFLNIKRII